MSSFFRSSQSNNIDAFKISLAEYINLLRELNVSLEESLQIDSKLKEKITQEELWFFALRLSLFDF